MHDSRDEAVAATIRQINRLWLDDLGPMVHPEMVAVMIIKAMTE